jgi:hypothetical protein
MKGSKEPLNAEKQPVHTYLKFQFLIRQILYNGVAQTKGQDFI